MSSATTWQDQFATDLSAAAAKAGVDITGLKWERCTTDRTWGDRDALVFFGASDEVCERAARFFEAWASKNRSIMGIGKYEAQESIGYFGPMYFSRYDNGASGWYPMRSNKVDFDAITVTSDYGRVTRPVELRRGVATNFVYYPCAE